MILVWLFSIAYAVVTFLAPFYLISMNDKLKETNEMLHRMEGAVLRGHKA